MYVKKSVFITFALVFILLVEIGFIIASRCFNVLTLSKYRKISQSEFRLETSNTSFGFSKEIMSSFLLKVREKINLKENFDYTFEEAREIREKLLNILVRDFNGERVSEINDPFILLDDLISGKYLLCGEMAKLYAYVLHSVGFKVRLTTVTRSIFDSWDKHTFVEIWDVKRKKWIISDPTFNISFKNDSSYLSSDELYDLIHMGKFESIKVEHGKLSSYEIPLEEFYISYYSLFDDLYYVPYKNRLEISEFPPLRWFDKRFDILLVESNRFPIRGSSILIQDFLMFFVLLFNPTLIVIATLLLIFQKIIIKIFHKKEFRLNFFEPKHSTFRIKDFKI